MIIKKRQSVQNIQNMQKRFLQTDLNHVNLCHLSPSALLSSGNVGYCIMCMININTIEHEIQRYTTEAVPLLKHRSTNKGTTVDNH